MLVVLLVVAAGTPGAVGAAAAQQEVTLTVTVVAETGGTVSDVELTATWDGGSVTEPTRANGQALIDVPRDADVEISVEHDVYMRNAPYEVRDASSAEIEIPVARKGTAVVSVVDGEDPINSATVRFQDGGDTAASVRTGPNGVAEVGPIEQGNYALIVSKPGYYEHTSNVDVGEGTERQVTIERGTVDVTFAVADDHFDSPRPVDNASIAIDPVGSSLVTLNDGTVTTSIPVNRNYDVTVTRPGYESVTRELRVGESPTELSATIRRTPNLTVRVSNGRVVVGETTRVTVTDEYGDPVQGATVLRNGESVGETDANGEFDVGIESAGEVTIEVRQGGLADSASVEGVQPGGADDGNATTADGDTDGGLGPGFGPLLALTAMALVAVFLARRR